MRKLLYYKEKERNYEENSQNSRNINEEAKLMTWHVIGGRWKL